MVFSKMNLLININEKGVNMIDPVTALATATRAYQLNTKGFQAGREIEDMAGSLSKWMGAVSDIKKAEEYNKKPPLFKKLFQSGSVEEEAMQIFMAKKKAEDMRDQLRQIIQLTRGHNAWQELLKTEADIRTRRQKAVYDQQERQRMWIEGTAIVLLILVTTGVIGFIVWGLIQRNGGI